MAGPIRFVLDDCARGIGFGKKLGYTLLALLLVASPIDVIPDVFMPVGFLDDLVVLYLLIRVWLSQRPSSLPVRSGVTVELVGGGGGGGVP